MKLRKSWTGLAVGGLPLLALAACSVMPSVWPLAGPRPGVGPFDQPPTPVSSRDWKVPPKGYLPDGGAPDALKILGPPPTPGSKTGKADKARFEATRDLAGSARWTMAQRDADLSGGEAWKSYGCAAGVRIGPDTTPVLARMMLRIEADAAPVYSPIKDRYDRKRPPVGNNKQICVPRETWIYTNGSYPSGHSLIGWSWGLVLAELVPDRSSQLVARGRDFGDSRVICGVHWQSDVDAGRDLGSALVARLHADPGFMADLAKARDEIAAARKLGPPEGCGA
ncbi:acid phosphatase (class A) [Caulobacter ginsengisoli]|uniref:Acid phosphatase (Class A) n=1 Tax=Caulobacter ginsengisoli TaxID=400775 RepID=A0ABU0IWW7_9CAUL|nr:phosphatase PAP2 family protein [Caulobacter ginsengisoli]MDQ0466511.1 acid phosphatase (class A) [Caulobacter ginsengisoli]